METSEFRIDVVNMCLWRRNGAAVDERLELAPKTFDVLRYLAENAGRLITHDELLTALWRNVHVQPEVLKSHVLAIRNVLGDKSSSPRFIETRRGRGYRFIGPINSFGSTRESFGTAMEASLLAGRAEPLRELQALLQRATAGEPQAIFVSGEPGIGKTTLVEEFLSRVASDVDPFVAKGHCIEGFAGAEPYYPVLEALRSLCTGNERARTIRSLLDLAPTWAAQMADQIPAAQRAALRPQGGSDARSHMIREACSLFEHLAAQRPLALVLEDLHWADFATIDFMSALCRRRSSAKLLLIGTYRSEDLETGRCPLKQMIQDLTLHRFCGEIELTPLSTTGIAEVLSGSAESEPAPSEFTGFIEQRTGGNPLFIRVTLDYLYDRGHVSRMAHGWRLLVPEKTLASEIPPTLVRMIETKIEGMTGEEQRILEAASAAGDAFDPVTAAPAAGVDEQSFEVICERLTPSMVRRGELLSFPNGRLAHAYMFNHAMYRQVIYARIGPVRRTYLHRAIGERLETIYPPDQRNDLAVQLVRHFSLACDWSRALSYLRTALRVAGTRFARRDMLAMLDYASELVANLSDSARVPAELELLERRAAIQALANDPAAVETYAQLAGGAGQHGDIDTQCRALIGLAYTLSWNDLARSLQILDQVLVLCDEQSDPIERDVTRLSASVRRLWEAGWNKADASKCEEVLARLEATGDSLTIARAQINFSMLCLVSTRYQMVIDLVESSHSLLIDSPQRVAESEFARAGWMRNIGVPWSRFSLGDFGGALAELDAKIEAFEKNDDQRDARFLGVFRGALLFHAMNFEGVLRDCGQVASQPFERHALPAAQILPLELRIALIFCGLAEAAIGNYTAALEHLRRAESEMERQPVHLDWYWRLALEWGMVGVLVSHGDRRAALSRSVRLCKLAAQTDDHAWQALAWEAQARAALSCGEMAGAVDAVERALSACEGMSVPLAEWRVHATCAMIYRATQDATRASRHTRLGETVRLRLAESFPEGHPLRRKFELRSASLFAA